MKQVSLRVVTGLVLIAIIVTATIAYFAWAAAPTTDIWIGPGIYPGASSYTIWRDGSNYFAKDANGYTAYGGTNISKVLIDCHTALPATGGNIYLTALSAVVTASILITKPNITIFGTGWGTLLKPSAGVECIFNVTGDHFSMYNIRLTGNSVDGAHGVILGATAEESEIHHCYINAFNQSAIETISGCHVTYIHDNWLSSNGNTSTSACLMLNSLGDSIIQGNQLGGGKYTVKASGGYILLEDNKIFGASDYHIYLDSPKRFIIDGNVIGGGTPYPQYDNIFITGSTSYQEGSIISNNIFYSGGSPWGRDGIRMAGATCQNHTIMGNIFFNVTNVAVYEYHASCDFNVIIGNSFVDCDIPLELKGEHTIARDNRMDVPNEGFGEISSGTSDETITVGFLNIYSKVFLTIRNGTGNLATGEWLKVSAISVYPTNQFTVSCADGGTASTDIYFYYKVEN